MIAKTASSLTGTGRASFTQPSISTKSVLALVAQVGSFDIPPSNQTKTLPTKYHDYRNVAVSFVAFGGTGCCQFYENKMLTYQGAVYRQEHACWQVI
jgi:hypothetical protein